MKINKSILLLFVIISVISCKNTESTSLSDTEVWKMGWRMMQSTFDENNEMASAQFDSLVNLNVQLETVFLVNGLEIKSKLGKDSEVQKILATQNQEVLQKICAKSFLENQDACKNLPEVQIKNKELQLELIEMGAKDQASRGNLQEDLISKYNLNKKQIMEANLDIDEENRNRLKEILDRFGFPTKELVGQEAMDGLFWIIQHADGDTVWQKSQLPNIEVAVKKGEMNGRYYAYLYDRVSMHDGRKQRYGTQFKSVDKSTKVAELFETEDLQNLDKRRMEVGMMPIAMYKKIMLEN